MTIKKADRKENPVKYFLYFFCRMLYLFGLGNCWYEHRSLSFNRRILYVIWCLISNGYLALTIMGEISAIFRTDLTPTEQNDLIQFIWAHPCVYSKFIFYTLQRNRIREFLKTLLDDTRAIYTKRVHELAAIKDTKMYCTAVMLSAYITLFMVTIDALISYFKEGIPARTEITYWPRSGDPGIFAKIIQVLLQFHWWYLVTIMIIVDGLSIACLTVLRYKFKIIQEYFEELRTKVTRNPKGLSQTELGEQMARDLLIGIKLHRDTLWCANQLQYALKNIYSIQIIESITLLVMCLIKLAASDGNLMYWFSSLMYISCIAILTGSYMMAGGNVSYEAGMVSISIFHCGWEYCGNQVKLQPLLMMAIQRSQMPVNMNAFGILDLSYNNLISVLRMSYSFFAVMVKAKH